MVPRPSMPGNNHCPGLMSFATSTASRFLQPFLKESLSPQHEMPLPCFTMLGIVLGVMCTVGFRPQCFACGPKSSILVSSDPTWLLENCRTCYGFPYAMASGDGLNSALRCYFIS
ncbi:hypothetical protein GOODEAATRI_000024 [Goodea atripinnis]|uniref:Uncharacterized protein n=1 Tax=Goodea atripinnis TaxID=208336 RepID=A0ABV0PJI4_9TELE